jgi:transaldolase
MPSKLDQLKAMTTVVADTGDVDAIRRFGAVDATTNPTLILKAAHMPNHARLLEGTVLWGRAQNRLTSEITDRLALNFGLELAKIVPGRVSTEVDADLSFDIEGTAAKARAIIAAYEKLGLSRERVLIKIAATWEGIRAAEILQSEGIDCNMTLAFSLAQAAACADAGLSSGVFSIGTARPRARATPRKPIQGSSPCGKSTIITRPTGSRPSSWARRSATRAKSRLWPVATG